MAVVDPMSVGAGGAIYIVIIVALDTYRSGLVVRCWVFSCSCPNQD